MFIVIWEFRVRPEKVSEFESAYLPDGAWADLFKNDDGYLGTELLQSNMAPGLYMTIDRWDSKESYENFLVKWKAEYGRLDEQCEGLTESEKRIGGFRQVTP
jgi:heme-degrading monooxygenase HmoA